MAVNPNGFVPIADGGAPFILTGVSEAVISGGQFIGAAASTAGLVGSGRDSYTTSDIILKQAATGNNFLGIAMADAASGAELSIATRGFYIVAVSGTAVVGGDLVGCNSDSEVIQSVAGSDFIGRALVPASGGEFTILQLG